MRDPYVHAEKTPLTVAEQLELIALGEHLARYYRHPARVHSAVLAGASWEQVAAAAGTTADAARAAYAEWAEEQHRLRQDFPDGTIGSGRRGVRRRGESGRRRHGRGRCPVTREHVLLPGEPVRVRMQAGGCQHEMRMIARAQVHATLALAAAVRRRCRHEAWLTAPGGKPSLRTVSRDRLDSALSALRGHLGELETALALWATRDDTKAQPRHPPGGDDAIARSTARCGNFTASGPSCLARSASPRRGHGAGRGLLRRIRSRAVTALIAV